MQISPLLCLGNDALHMQVELQTQAAMYASDPLLEHNDRMAPPQCR